MFKKAIAAHTIFLVGVIVIFIFFVTATFFGWIDWSGTSANQFACSAKLYNYCSELQKTGNAPWDWNEKEPRGCENPPVNITKPTKDECDELFPQIS